MCWQTNIRRGAKYCDERVSLYARISQQELSSYWDWRPCQNEVGRKVGGWCVPFRGGAGSPCNTMSRGPRRTSVPSFILIHPAVWPQHTWAENWGLCPFWGELGLHLTQCGLGRGLPPYQVTSDPSNRLATIDRVKWRHISMVAIRSPLCRSTPS